MKKYMLFILLFLVLLPFNADAAKEERFIKHPKKNKKDQVRLGSMEIIGRIEAPLVDLDLTWQSPKFLSRSMNLPMRSFEKETFDSFPGKSFFKYKKKMQKRRRVMLERFPR